MLLYWLKVGFGFIAFLLSISLSVRVYGEKLFKNNNKLSPFVAFIGGLFVLYILSALLLAVFCPGILFKLIMFLFAVAPFILGKLVNYKQLKMYSTIQILCVILSMVFVIFY
jgi:hypothetical protein